MSATCRTANSARSPSRFPSSALYDNQTRSMLDTPQRYPRAGSQSYPSPAAEPDADGATTIYFSPTQPEGVKRGNWIRPCPEKAGSRSCVSTAPSSLSSPKSGDRAKSNWCVDGHWHREKHFVTPSLNVRYLRISLKNPLLRRPRCVLAAAVSEAKPGLYASCGEDRRRERNELRQFPQILGCGGQ
jgi:hypothetical protein